MGKTPDEFTDKDVNCLSNLVVAYNTVFLMSSIFIVSIAGTSNELFSEAHRLLSPSILLLIVAGFILFIAGMGYFGVGKKSSTIISMYTLLLVFVFVMEIAAGFGILSFRGEIKSMVSAKMRRALGAYTEDPMTANLVDYVQLELNCCGVKDFSDWNNTLTETFPTDCVQNKLLLPQSCCRKINSTMIMINQKGCLPALNCMLHRSTLLLSTTIIAICTVQVLGAYFSYSLASTINKVKLQKLNYYESHQNRAQIPVGNSQVGASQMDYREKSNYF